MTIDYAITGEALLIWLVVGTVAPHSSAAQSAAPDDPSKVDLRVLEKEILG